MPTADEQFAATLARTEMLPRAQLLDYRNGLLRRLASFAFAQSPFYRDRLKPLFRGGGEPDLSAWGEVPILRKADLQNEIDRINPQSPPAEIGEVFTITTSGTTADPMQFRGCAIARTAEAVMMHRLYRWHGFDLGAPMASIRSYSSGRNAYPEGTTEARWSFPGPQAAHHLLDLRTSVDNIIRWLAARRPAYLLTFPSLAHEIAQHPRASHVAEIGLKHIVAISEIVTEDARAAVRAHLGCEMAQIYGCSEVGAIALQSEADDSLSICDKSVLVELLDDSGEPVRPGETGQVVLTSLYNYATPFIRYDIGDFATLAETLPPAAAWRGFAAWKDGCATHSSAPAAAGSGRAVSAPTTLLPACAAGNFRSASLIWSSIEVIYVPDDVAAAPVGEQELTEYFAKLLGRPVQVMLTAVNEIPRNGRQQARTDCIEFIGVTARAVLISPIAYLAIRINLLEIIGTIGVAVYGGHRRQRSAVVDDAKQRLRYPLDRIVLTVALDQCLVFLAKIESQAAPDALEVAFPDAAFDEGGRHQRTVDAPSELTAESKRVLAPKIAVADKDLEVVVEVIGQVHLVEEACLDVVAVDDRGGNYATVNVLV